MKLKLSFFFFCVVGLLRADEGMWMPQLIEALNIKDMKKNGLKLSAEQIYSINKASMKDGVAIFGGGCTSELISDKGLLLTNHHCGFSSIAGLSSVEHDYLKKGFFAKTQQEEMPCKGLTVTFIKKIADVTKQLLDSMDARFTELQRDSAIASRIGAIEKKEKTGSFDAFVRPFYYGNEYYLFVTEVFKDIRLVGTPPESLGKFGGETDNWVWPRHNADFSLFRIYANKENKPAEYSNENMPYKPRWFFPISLKGANEGDFTMVYGFPGRTQEYLTSYAVDLLVKQQDPIRVKLRETRLEILDEAMKKNDTLRLMYTARYAGVANYAKKWKGEMLGLMKSDAVFRKKKFEAEFLSTFGGDNVKKDKYAALLKQLEKLYADYAPLSRQYDYYTECLLGIDALRMTGNFVNVFAELKKKLAGKENKFAQVFKDATPAIPFKNFDRETDKKLCRAMLLTYEKEVDRGLMPQYIDSLLQTQKGNIWDVTSVLYNSSKFVDNEKAKAMFADFEKNYAKYEKDPMYALSSAISQHYQKKIQPQLIYIERQIAQLQKEYMLALKENVKDKKFYPDANGTLRVAYGKVNSYKPRDGMLSLHYTTLDGLVEKNKSGEEDFAVDERVIQLYQNRDFGDYTDKNGQVRTAFIASNHTTGGNSGSPVLNGKGELIGTNFDRNWEGTMSDVMYNRDLCRNIVLDIHFTLWVIDRFAGAGYLLNEMKIIK
jgi:hypothetical protein